MSRTRRRDARGLAASLVLGSALACLGCAGAGGGATAPAGVAVDEGPPDGSPLVGYGVVNYWHRLDPEAFAEVLSQNGLTLTGIEYLPWFEGGDCGCKLGGGCSVDAFPEEAAAFVEAMRSRGITTLVNVVNWNSCAAREREDRWFVERIDEIVERIGTEGVILSPVSEPWVEPSEVPRRWAGAARERWTGLFAAPNDGASGPDPIWPSVLHDFVDIHHCRDDALLAGLWAYGRDRLHSTDCTPITNPGAERAAAFTAEAVAAGAHLFVYGFDDEEPDGAVIEAMGARMR